MNLPVAVQEQLKNSPGSIYILGKWWKKFSGNIFKVSTLFHQKCITQMNSQEKKV